MQTQQPLVPKNAKALPPAVLPGPACRGQRRHLENLIKANAKSNKALGTEQPGILSHYIYETKSGSIGCQEIPLTPSYMSVAQARTQRVVPCQAPG